MTGGVILHVVGARPNFMKVAPVVRALQSRAGISQVIVHTGQHYDANMSEVFFRQLDIPKPDINLEVGSGSHALQTAQIMSRFEPVVLGQKPGLVLVYGDVNSTVATALVCSKLLIPVGHVEAGLRSFDRTMPEEINRLLTDQVADLLFTPSADGDENLAREGVSPDKVHLVGNVMIDTLVHLLPKADDSFLEGLYGNDSGTPRRSEGTKGEHAQNRGYMLVTLHRPSNVDDPEMLGEIIFTLKSISRELDVIFPIHPRTRARLRALKIPVEDPRLKLTEPVGYLQFIALQQKAAVIVTDSGGIQEEATYLGIPCLTLRENTERPITITAGTNILVGRDMGRLRKEVDRILSGEVKKGGIPPLWDGKASERIAAIVDDRLSKS
ncbi:MAG: non-hydrolyzing UDP-N-acetylglucosamine 2-epimerase [bacterium]